MGRFAEMLVQGELRWARQEIIEALGINIETWNAWENEKKLPRSIVMVAKIALFFDFELQPFLEQWIKRMRLHYGFDSAKARITNTLLLLLPAIARTEANSLYGFSRAHGYSHNSIRFWLYGFKRPSPLIIKRLGKDLAIDVAKIEEAIVRDAQGDFPARIVNGRIAERKRPTYPSVLARLIHQARQREGISLLDLEKIGFPTAAINQIENEGRLVYGVESGKLLELADILRISRLDITIAYLMDKMNQGASTLNLEKIPFVSAKRIILLGVVNGLFPKALEEKAGFTRTKMYKFMAGKRLATREELDMLVSILDPDEDDLQLIMVAWKREHKNALERERRRRQRTWKELIDGFPMERLSPREVEFLWLDVQRGWSLTKIGRKRKVPLSRERVRQIRDMALEKIAHWREKQ